MIFTKFNPYASLFGMSVAYSRHGWERGWKSVGKEQDMGGGQRKSRTSICPVCSNSKLIIKGGK